MEIYPVQPDKLTEFGGRLRWVLDVHLGVESHAEFARDTLGVHPQQLSRWVNSPTPPSEPSLDLLSSKTGITREWLRYGVGEPAPGISAGGSGAGLPGEEGMTAEKLIQVLDHPAGLRDVVSSKVSLQDIIKIAYAIALEEHFPPSEMAKLDEWRNSRLQAREVEANAKS